MIDTTANSQQSICSENNFIYSQADWEAGIKIANLFKIPVQNLPQPATATNNLLNLEDQKVKAGKAVAEEPRFSGYKDSKKKSSGKKRSRAQLSAQYVPLFDEDSDGCIVARDQVTCIQEAQERF